MIPVTSIVVRSFDLDHLDVSWMIPGVPSPGDAKDHTIFDYEFFVLRSEAAMGPYDVIGGPFRDQYNFRDMQVSLRNKWRQWFYKIRVHHIPSDAIQDFGPAASNEAAPDLHARAVQFELDVLFREFIGTTCFLFPVRTFGPYCSCFDPVGKRVTRSRHRPCFGTGFLGGYLSPVQMYVQIDPNPKVTQQSSLQPIQAGDTTSRTISFPPIKPDDILVEANNTRWRVVRQTSTQKLRAVLHQELVLHQIPIGDIEYELPVNLDAMSLERAAGRNYTNPQNIEDGNDDYDDILSLVRFPDGSLR